MSTHKHIDRICAVAVIFALLITIVFMNGEALGIQAASRTMGYETRLFNTEKVHTIDIVMDDWDGFIETCENEEYAVCAVVIDGEAYKNVGIRAKGNTSLSNVSSMNSDRYSFKIEFDQYDSTKSYYGLDKLSLNNIIQDSTFMKDYLTYRMMDEFGVDAPLCSYVYITVNGEDWGLYLAVEGVEDAFLQRNYGTNHGELYKPDSMSFGGGRGNGKEFNMDDFFGSSDGEDSENSFRGDRGNGLGESGADTSGGTMPGADGQMSGGTMPGMNGQVSGDESQSGNAGDSADGNGQTSGGMTLPEGMEIPDGMTLPDGIELPDGMTIPEDFDFSDLFSGDMDFSNRDFGNRGGGMSMGSSDVKLQYIDDDPDSYSNIFNNAKTDITEADQTRLIESLKALSAGENIEEVVNVEEVIRYFVVHNFVCNGDSYTGSMIHNYYLYEEDGQLSMIPWDYNLAFGGFQSSNATSTVNEPIDSPVSGGMDDRPMIAWIFENEEYTELYHQYFAEFLETIDFAAMIDETVELIAPYVEKDPTKFYTYEEFETGAATLKEFCLLREESIEGQLAGTIPSTTDGQSADDSALIDASHITISDMGSMGMGGNMGGNMCGEFSGGRGGKTDSMGTGSGSRGEDAVGGNAAGDNMDGVPGDANGDSGSVDETVSVPDGSAGDVPGNTGADGGMTGSVPGNMGDMGGQMPSGAMSGQLPSGDMSGQLSSDDTGSQMPSGDMSCQMPGGDISGQTGGMGQMPSGDMTGQTPGGDISGQTGDMGQMPSGGMTGMPGMGGESTTGGTTNVSGETEGASSEGETSAAGQFPGGMSGFTGEIPEGMEDFTGKTLGNIDGSSSRGDFMNNMGGQTSGGMDSSALLSLAVSAVVLVVGLVIVFKYKKYS